MTSLGPDKARRPFVAAVRVPDEVRLVIHAEGGMDALGGLLHEFGHAQHLAHVSDDGPRWSCAGWEMPR